MNESENIHSLASTLLKNPSKFQRILHWSNDQVCYYGHFIKSIAYNVHTWEKMAVRVNEKNYSFTVNGKHDLLRLAYLQFTTPSIRVAKGMEKKIQIAWTRKLAHFASPKIMLKFDGEPGPYIDSHSLNIYEQYEIDAGHQTNYSRAIGDIDELTVLTDHLPSYRFLLWIPLFFAFDPALAMPLFRCTSQNLITIDVTFESEISNLLRYEERTFRDGREGISVEVDFSNLQGLEDISSRSITPEMYGKYIKLTEDEMKEIRESSVNYMNIPTYVAVNAGENRIPINSSHDVKLNIDFNTKALFWMGEGFNNVNDRRIFANYTSKLQNYRQGANPCNSASISLSNRYLIQNFPQEHFEYIESRNFTAAPRDPGYNAFCFGENNYVVDVESGLDLAAQDAKLTIMFFVPNKYALKREARSKFIALEPTNDIQHETLPLDPLNSSDAEKSIIRSDCNEEPNITNYRAIVRALVTRRIYFINEGTKTTIKYPELDEIIDMEKI